MSAYAYQEAVSLVLALMLDIQKKLQTPFYVRGKPASSNAIPRNSPTPDRAKQAIIALSHARWPESGD